ncbi:type II toxin-antitoxin system VapB family antitoxin [Nesterenkonia suensis]
MTAARASDRARVFYSNRSQAVRLPREVAFPRSVRDVLVIPVEDMLLLKPAPKGWAELFDDPANHAAPDLLQPREQLELQDREW